MGETGLAVLAMVLLVGLIMAFALPWVSLLLSTGFPRRRAAREAGPPMPVPREREVHAGRAAAGSVLAILLATLLLALLVPDLADQVPQVKELPSVGLVMAFAALIVSVTYALPAWLGVRR